MGLFNYPIVWLTETLSSSSTQIPELEGIAGFDKYCCTVVQ